MTEVTADRPVEFRRPSGDPIIVRPSQVAAMFPSERHDGVTVIRGFGDGRGFRIVASFDEAKSALGFDDATVVAPRVPEITHEAQDAGHDEGEA